MARKRARKTAETQTLVEDVDLDAKPKIVRIPVSTRFQANIPDYTGLYHSDTDPTTEKWLSNQTWPIQPIQPASSSTASPNTKRMKRRLEEEIGKRWDVLCTCRAKGSPKCVESHVKEVRIKLKEELQSAYGIWKFDQIGSDVVSESWTKEERETFKHVVKMNPKSIGGNDGGGFGSGRFMNEEALKALPTKNRAEIVSYYMNVYLPNRISGKSRDGCEYIDTDVSDGEENGSSSSGAKKYLSGN